MHGPSLVAWLLVALSAAAAVACLVRAEDRDEAVMGAGMTLMALPVSVLDPRPWCAPAFAVVYTAAALRAVLPGAHSPGHRVHHVVCSAAMVYMAVAMAGSGPSHPGGGMAMGGAGSAVATGLFLLYFAVYVLRTGARLASAAVTVPVPAPAPAAGGLIPGAAVAGPAPAPAPTPTPTPMSLPLRHAPEVAVACRVSMALGMVVMLLAM
ncbi:protein of unknown function [Actinacidiphila yanglinensis]|uniref:DUF5134 domain-containing protein n=1 Tax=Actinacidiphila yanglinensis TaxID=310779 RepID=A0A1H6DY12_9ACTN|nr:DUF5134 domain-containing protein [Actinacidiphila yanglinensis]SEG89934.1 protein of unknown function [Actinacidiphila yanglinensis]